MYIINSTAHRPSASVLRIITRKRFLFFSILLYLLVVFSRFLLRNRPSKRDLDTKIAADGGWQIGSVTEPGASKVWWEEGFRAAEGGEKDQLLLKRERMIDQNEADSESDGEESDERVEGIANGRGAQKDLDKVDDKDEDVIEAIESEPDKGREQEFETDDDDNNNEKGDMEPEEIGDNNPPFQSKRLIDPINDKEMLKAIKETAPNHIAARAGFAGRDNRGSDVIVVKANADDDDTIHITDEDQDTRDLPAALLRSPDDQTSPEYREGTGPEGRPPEQDDDDEIELEEAVLEEEFNPEAGEQKGVSVALDEEKQVPVVGVSAGRERGHEDRINVGLNANKGDLVGLSSHSKDEADILDAEKNMSSKEQNRPLLDPIVRNSNAEVHTPPRKRRRKGKWIFHRKKREKADKVRREAAREAEIGAVIGGVGV